MKSNETSSLLQIIQAKTGDSLDAIAEKTGYTRPYISRIKAAGGSETLNNRLREVYSEILPKVTDPSTEDRLKVIEASLKVLFAGEAARVSRETGLPAQSALMQLEKAVADVLKQG